MSSTIILFDADAGAAAKSLALHHCVCSTVWMCSPAELLTHGEVIFHKTSMFYNYIDMPLSCGISYYMSQAVIGW